MSRRRIPLWLLMGLSLWWLITLVANYQYETDPEEETTAGLRAVDITLSISNELENHASWLRKLYLFDAKDVVEREAVVQMTRWNVEGDLDKEGREALRMLQVISSGDLAGVQVEEWQSAFDERVAWAWESKILEDRYGEGGPDWVQEAIAEGKEFQRELFFWYTVGEGISWAVLLVGIPFVPAAWRCFLQSTSCQPPPLARFWRWDLLLGILILVDICGDWCYLRLYSLLSMVFQDDSVVLEVVSDGAWRVLGPVVFIGLFLVDPRHAWRALNLHRAPVIKPILGMLTLVQLYNLGLFFVMDEIAPLSWKEDVILSEDGWEGLIYAVFSAVIFAPLVEEIVYRGFLFNGFSVRMGFTKALVLSTVLFVFIHFYGVYGSLSVASFGVAACVLYRATGSLWTPILYHALVNGMITAYSWPVYNWMYSR